MISTFTPYSMPNIEAPFASVTIGASAQALHTLLPLHEQTESVFIAVEGAPIRIIPNKTAPTTSLGVLLDDGDSAVLSRAEYLVARAIRTTGVDATVQIAQNK